jgi:hypothetical protein
MAKVGIWGIEGLPRIGAPGAVANRSSAGNGGEPCLEGRADARTAIQAARDEIGYLG